MFRSRKSQLTMIIIVGLLLLVVFYFLFALRKELAPDSKANSNLVYELESGLIKDHITSCIERVTSDAVEKLGANGGVIYDFEGGTIPYDASQLGKTHLDYRVGARTVYVQHGLLENSYCAPISYAHPDYPIAGLALSALGQAYLSDDSCAYGNSASDFDGVFGQVNLTKLCPFSVDSSCPVFAKGSASGLTMKSQVEDYLKNKLDLCVNLTYFGDQYNANLALEGSVNPRVSIREDDIQVSVNYPVRITFKDAAPISKVVDYHASINIRLGSLYYFLYDVLSKDARDLSFDLEKNALASSYYKQGFELKKVKDSCASCAYPSRHDDVVEVMDSSSVVNGRPLLFRTAVQDRRPVLDFIPDETHDLGSVLSIYELRIPIKAVDPDDTKVTYYFLSEGLSPGWRESPPASSPIEQQPAEDSLHFFLDSATDLGTHNVAVLAVDESGYFDFQRFKVVIENSAANNPISPNCMNDCTLGDASQCASWCWLSSNVCNGDCLGAFAITDPSCNACVDPLFRSGENEAHIQCSGLPQADCVSNMPDCFWVEDSDGINGDSGSCRNDRELEAVLRYASIKN
jgi:hypothetical protein